MISQLWNMPKPYVTIESNVKKVLKVIYLGMWTLYGSFIPTAVVNKLHWQRHWLTFKWSRSMYVKTSIVLVPFIITTILIPLTTIAIIVRTISMWMLSNITFSIRTLVLVVININASCDSTCDIFGIQLIFASWIDTHKKEKEKEKPKFNFDQFNICLT